jgi:hypothetical protein
MGRRLARLAVPVAAALSLYANVAAGQDEGSSWALGVHFENDLFADTDQQYTSGVKITAVSPDLSSRFRDRPELPGWARALVPKVPLIREGGIARTLAFSLGQNIYTPQDTASPDLVPDDRPYAGWLYFATTFQSRERDRQDTFDVQLGIIGPYSFAEQTQELVHRARGIAVPKGWSHQLRNEPGLVLAYERVWRVPVIGTREGLGADLLPRLGGAVGNVAVYASVGAQLRAGYNLPPDFGYSAIRPGGVTQVDALRDRPDERHAQAAPMRRERFSVHLFAGTDVRLVGHDIFLDGNTFRDSHSVEPRRLVTDLVAGVTMGYGGLKLSLANVLRTREFRGAPRDHRFGSITLTYAF